MPVAASDRADRASPCIRGRPRHQALEMAILVGEDMVMTDHIEQICRDAHREGPEHRHSSPAHQHPTHPIHWALSGPDLFPL